MKTIITALALLISAGANSQVESPRTTELGKWKIGMTGSYVRHFQDVHVFQEEQSGFAPGGCYEQPYYEPQINFTAGIVSSYSILPKLEIGLGVAYSRQQPVNDMLYLPFTCGTGTDFSQCYYIPNPSRFIETPVFVRYYFLKTKLNFHVESGLTASFGLNNYSEMSPKYNLRTQGGLGMSYTFGGLINVSATAFYKRRITDFNRIMNLNNTNSIAFELRTSFVF
ncbi:MAG: hypothetical protein ACJASQ_003345 [Crocinitomicaceae bacterium]|jgi:hypothetical protein